MKTEKTKKNFDAVGYMRKVRDKISKDIAELSNEQIIEYFKKNRPKKRIIPSA
jgi:hypothetical protein